MDLASVIRSRRSVRVFTADPVPDSLLQELVDLATWAPSAGNLQSRDFVVVRDPRKKEALAHAADQDEIARAAAVVAVFANAERVARYGNRGRDLYALQDAAAATQNLLLAAHERGLGAVWMGAFDEEEVREILGAPRHARPVALVPVGWPAEHPAPPTRLPLEDVLHWDRW